MADNARNTVNQVIGWLALRLHHPSHGVLATAEHLTYAAATGPHPRPAGDPALAVWAGPVISVQWRGGPQADNVAEYLCGHSAGTDTTNAADEPDMLASPDHPAIGPDASPDHASVTVHSVMVLLDREPAARRPDAAPPGQDLLRQWLNPIKQEGVARSLVIWQSARTASTGSAAVLHLPFGIPRISPTYGVVDCSVRTRSNAESIADVWLDTAAPGWDRRDASERARTMFRNSIDPDHGPGADIAAVRLPSPHRSPEADTFCMRVRWGRVAPDLEVLAEPVETRWVAADDEQGDRAPGMPSETLRAYTFSALASAVLSAATTSTGVVPGELWVYPVWHSLVQTLFRLEVNEVASPPTR